MKEIKIRIEDDELVEDIDLWLRSGQLRVSRTKLLEALLLAFGESIRGEECNIETVAGGIQNAIKVGTKRLNKQRFPND